MIRLSQGITKIYSLTPLTGPPQERKFQKTKPAKTGFFPDFIFPGQNRIQMKGNLILSGKLLKNAKIGSWSPELWSKNDKKMASENRQ